eukprot:jgi/Mesvir1/20972/Mv08039-RA.1
MLYLVTGGTGFLGIWLVKKLLSTGHNVRVIARSPSDELPSSVVFYPGSILDESVLREAVKGVDGVFHLAGLVEHSRRRTKDIEAVNMNGTLHVLEACVAARVKRVVYASTSGTVAVSTDSSYVADDKAPYAKEVTKKWPYYRTKIDAEAAAIEYAKKHGLYLVVMRPTLLLGPGDWRLSSCRTVYDLMSKAVPFIPTGGLSYVDVRDAANAFATAMTQGRPWATYLLAAKNMTVEDFFTEVSGISGVPGPWLRIPNVVAWAMAASAHGLMGLFGRWDPSLDEVLVEMAHHYWYVDASAAKQDLKFAPRDPQATLRDTVAWISENKARLKDV